MNLGNETTQDLWAELITNWQAINQAQTALYMAKNNQNIAFDRLVRRVEGRIPEQMVVVLDNLPYIIDLDVEEFRIMDIRVADMITIKELVDAT